MRTYFYSAVSVALVALIVFVGWQGYRMGKAFCVAAYNAERLAQIDMARELEAERLKVAAERDELARQLEVKANEDPVTTERCLGPSRLQRLNQIR